MKIRILTESVKGLGLGHVARSYNLACVFLEMGYEVDFFVRGNAEFSDFLKAQHHQQEQNLLQYFYPLHIAWEEIANKSLIECDICVIDSYEINDFSLFLSHTKVVVLLDDDGRHLTMLQEYFASLESRMSQAKLFLLNPNGFYALEYGAKKHLPLVMQDCIFSGLEYAMLNFCFYTALQNLRDKTLKRRNKSIVVCFGGEDSQDKSHEVFCILKELDSLYNLGLEITVILGANYRGKLLESPYFHSTENLNNQDSFVAKSYHTTQDDLLQDSQTKNQCLASYNILQNIPQTLLAQYLATSIYSIVSGGGILFEAVLLSQRTFALNLATNQELQIQILKKQGLIEEIPSSNLKESLQKIAFHVINAPVTESVANIKPPMGNKLKDFAAKLVLDSINQTLIKQHNKYKNFVLKDLIAINFCNMSEQESLRVLRYRNNPIVSENMYGSDIISARTHFNFICSLKKEEQSQYFLVQSHHDNFLQDIGVISLTRINLRHKNAYLGIYKNPELDKYNKNGHKLSYGSMLMEVIRHIAFNEYGLHILYLEVSAQNIQAIRFYEKEGFIFLGELLDGFKRHESKTDVFCNVLIYGIKNPLLS